VILDISPIGWFIVFVFYALAAVALIALWLWRKSIVTRALVVVLAPIALAAPLADELWIGWHFHEACKGAGVQVTRKVEIEGFYNATTSGPSEPGTVTNPQAIREYEKSGFRFWERRAGWSETKVSHVEKVNGEWHITILNRPTARYQYIKPIQDKVVSFKLRKIEYAVIDTQAGDQIGRSTIYKRYPGWVDGLWVGLFGSGMTMCPDPEMRPYQPSFPEAVLAPIKK
jgi:hypothetical protein